MSDADKDQSANHNTGSGTNPPSRSVSYAECMFALPNFRNTLLRMHILAPPATAFAARGAFSAFAAPLSNIHATGVGIRRRHGAYVAGEYVLKVFVFDSIDPDTPLPDILQQYQGIPVDIEHLPIQVVRPRHPARTAPETTSSAPQDIGQQEQLPSGTTAPRGTAYDQGTAAVAPSPADEVETHARVPNREWQRPIPAGVSISPLGTDYVGTLGCFLCRRRTDSYEWLALSNNHVLADTDRLAAGTLIVQPGPEASPFVTKPEDTFAALQFAIPIAFPTGANMEITNRFDAAIAGITNMDLIQPGVMLGIEQYDPSAIVPPLPGMRVVKSGRTTGVTYGLITAIAVDGVQVNYGTVAAPRIAVFDGTIEVVGVDEAPFSLPGDSGSVILEAETGHPVALLFAGDGVHTTACDLGALCRRLDVWPI